MELEALNNTRERIESLGATLVAITPQHSKISKTMQQEKNLAIEMLSDPGNEVAAAYGLRHKFPDDLSALYVKFSIDLSKFNGDDSWTLPMPGRFIIDASGIIRYAEINADYTIRPEPEDTVAALKTMVEG